MLRQLRDFHHLAQMRRDAKGVPRQWLKMAALFAVRHNGPGYYQMAGLWRRDRRFAELFDHWSQRRYLSELDRLNPSLYRKISQNKITEKAVLSLMHIPTPRYIGVLDPSSGRDAEGHPLRDADDLVRTFERDSASRVCFKLIEGTSGKGFVAVDVNRGAGGPRFRPIDDQCDLTAAALVDRLGLAADGPRLIEAFLEQDPVFASFNPSSVNTLRLWVLRRGDTTRTRLGYLRIGRRGAIVDNHGAGGIVAPIDFASGRLHAAHDGLPSRRVFPRHPDHGAPIEGVALPRLDSAVRLAEVCLSVFPEMCFAGMDVAMATDGPQIIELNVQPGRLAPAIVGTTPRAAFASDPTTS